MLSTLMFLFYSLRLTNIQRYCSLVHCLSRLAHDRGHKASERIRLRLGPGGASYALSTGFGPTTNSEYIGWNFGIASLC